MLENSAEFVQHSAAVAKEGVGIPKEDISNIRLVENSASALATMTLFPNSPFQQYDVPRADIVNIFLSNLPLEQDFDEAKVSTTREDIMNVECQL